MNRYNFIRIGFLLLMACFCLLARGQNKNPGGVSGTALWLIPTAVTSDLQGAYCWRNYVDQGLVGSIQYDDVVKIQENAIWQVPRDEIRSNNYQPLLPLGQDHLTKFISLRDIPLNQMTSFAVFTTAQHRDDLSWALYQINRDFNLFVATRSSIKYFSETKNDLPLNLEALSSIKDQDNLLYLFAHSIANAPSIPSVWGSSNTFSTSWGGGFLSNSLKIQRLPLLNMPKTSIALNLLSTLDGLVQQSGFR